MKSLSPRVRHTILGQWVAIGVLLMICTVMYTAFYRLSDCQSGYMARQYEAQITRSVAAETERKSLSELFQTLEQGDREKTREAIRAHADLLEKNDKARSEAPYPDFPKTC